MAKDPVEEQMERDGVAPMLYEDRERLGFLPHQVGWGGDGLLVVYLTQSPRGHDYSCSADAIAKAFKLWKDRDVEEAHFMLINHDGENAGTIEARRLRDIVKPHTPRPGKDWGDYFFLDSSFNVVEKHNKKKKEPQYFARLPF
jgi:hypothetical protein